MDRSKEAEYWHGRARAMRQEGKPGVAISFDNVAWLLSHPEGWLKWIEEQQRIAVERLKQ